MRNRSAPGDGGSLSGERERAGWGRESGKSAGGMGVGGDEIPTQQGRIPFDLLNALKVMHA